MMAEDFSAFRRNPAAGAAIGARPPGGAHKLKSMGPFKSGSHLARGAILVFAKLDRLTRNVDLLRPLVASEVDLALISRAFRRARLAVFSSRRWPQLQSLRLS
jgi:hypothetical protein